jgi:outer membrane protein TolC
MSKQIAAAAMLAALCIPGVRAEGAPITLQQAIQRALEVAPSIESAAAAREASDARVKEQRAPLYPSLSAGAEYYQAPGYSEVITNRGLSSGMLMLDWTAFDFGRRLAQLHAAEYVREAAALGINAARAQTVYDTRAAYYDVLRSRLIVRELQSSLARLTRYVATVEGLRRTGRAITNDVLKIRSARDGGELELAAAQDNAARASVALGTLLAEFNQSDIEVAELGALPPKPSGDLAQSPVMRAAERAISAANLQVNAALAERLPTFQVALTTGFLGIDPPKTVAHNFGASYDTVLSMPIFDGGAISSHIDQAKARVHAAAAQAREAEYLLSHRLGDASVRYDQAQRAIEILGRAQPTADDAFALTWTRFLGSGDVTVLEVLDAYQQAERLRLERFNQDYVAREAAAEADLIFGRVQ